MQSSLRNVLVISFGFLLLFTAFGGLQNLQSSLYNEDGLGVATLSSLYGAVLLSSMLLPPILIKRCGCKWTIVGSMCCYVAFSLGNFQASWFSLIPTSVLLGLGAAPLWSAQCTYLTVAGSRHAERTGQLGRDVVNQYFGIFFLIFQSSGVWGNLISSLVFGQTPTKVSGVLAILLIAVFLEPLEDFEPNGKGKDGKPPPFWTTLLSTFRLLGDGRLRLLILLPLYSGLQQGFISGEYTRSYTTCVLGIHFVGYVMICFSGATSLCSLLYGKLSQYSGRAAIYVLGAATHLSCIIMLLLWRPRPTQMSVFFLLPGLWGLADAVWQTQNNALYGVLFEKKKEAAFANYRLWEALGFVIAFGYSSFLCVSTKLYILAGVLSVAMLAYGVVEFRESKKTMQVLAAGEMGPAEEENAQSEM
ncbi:PREDICTED: protein unc-93 homolog A isoform X2 [Dipodomys ordii]|uniref:Protein unc-93 homolog A n=1 Tax=Dipodomys ordii TaxID=10020 RepID=A0A1S3FUE5_DIPOR|nr:PREDICTED: protein unc-93 homolog A isoform X2 [Dipodomys ordii]